MGVIYVTDFQSQGHKQRSNESAFTKVLHLHLLEAAVKLGISKEILLSWQLTSC